MRRLLLAGLVLLLGLDAARSMYARRAYSQPMEIWIAEDYSHLSWPPGAGMDRAAPLGARVFAQHCAVCHGSEGRGNGPAAPSLRPRPRDLTLGEFHYKSTGPDDPATDADVLRTVRDGLRASAMPYFRGLLSEEELAAVVAFVRSLGPQRPPGKALTVPLRDSPDTAGLARGADLYAKGCAQCHGQDLRGGPAREDEHGHPVPARDLTATWTYRGGAEPEQIWRRITTGLGPMPTAADWTTPGERWDIVNYVLSKERTPPWEPYGKFEGPGREVDPVKRGDYLTHAEMCALCHTHIDPIGIYRDDGYALAGGMRVGAWPHPTFLSRNLTSDVETGIGSQTAEQIATTIRTGRRFDRKVDPWGMPWFVLHAFEPDDALALASYLKTTDPVRNLMPPPVAFGAVETFFGKLTSPLPAAMPRKLTYALGNFGGGPDDKGAEREWPQRALVLAQWVVLALMALGILASRRWILFAVLAVLFGIAWLVLELPQVIPPDPLAQAVVRDIPRPDVRALPPHGAAMVERGRYLYTVASCAFCHGNRGDGGNKISWKPFGTLWARNISPDPETGIGGWSDAEIARALRSGVSRDGRQLHWQGMIWDLLSNLDEEDVRALIAYLRAIPPVRKAIPSAVPPGPSDCAIYTFYLRGDMSRPGCD